MELIKTTSSDLMLQESTQVFIKDLFEQGTAENTIKAYQKDMRYFGRWHELKYAQLPSLPLTVEVVTEFLTDHLGNMDPRLDKALVASKVKSEGPHRISTVNRRFASLSTAHRQYEYNPCKDARIKMLLSKAKKAAVKNGFTVVKKKAVTKDMLDELVATCGDSLLDKRDKALLLVGFGSGGRRRSEIVSLQMEDLEKTVTGYTIKLRSSKTDQEGKGLTLPIFGKAALALNDWLQTSGIESGALFRGITKGGQLNGRAQLNDKAVNRIIKRRAKAAGYDEEEIKKLGAHSLRSGFVTECGRQGITRGDGMALSGHKTPAIFEDYYQTGDIENNPAARLLG